MARSLLYRLDFSNGPSLFCSDDAVTFARGGSANPSYTEDPLYPEMCEAEAVKVVIGAGPNGENVLETSDGGDPSFAGILFTIPSLATVTELEVSVDMKVTAAVIADGMSNALPFWLSYDLGNSGVAVELYKYTGSLDGGPGLYFELGINGTDPFAGPYAEAYLQDQWVTLRARFTPTVGALLGRIVLDYKRQDQTTWTRLFTQDYDSDFETFDSAALGFYGMPGQLTNLDIYSGFGAPGEENAPLDPCCATSGAPGGGTNNPDGTTTPVGPRQGVSSGVAPSYTACAGGGALAAATDPTDPQSLDGITDPILHVVFDAPVDGDQFWGEDGINAGTTSKAIEARVVRYSEIPSEVLAGRDGVIPTPTFSVTLQDTDRQLRGWSQHASKRFFLGRFAEVLAESYGQRQLDTEARKLAAGYTIDWKFMDELLAEFTFADTLGWKRGALKRRVPLQTVTKDIFGQGVPDDSIGRPIPWVYGEMSDDYEWSLDNNRLPVGIVPCIPLGLCETIPFTNNLVPLTTGWQAFLVGKVCKTFTAMYLWNGSDSDGGAVRGRIPIDYPVIVDTMLPTQAAWTTYWANAGFVRVQAADGTLHDLTMGFARGGRAYEAANTGRFPVTYNVCGIEDVGDGSGNTILDGATAIAHFICYGIFSQHTTGAWGTIPTLPNGAPVINRASLTSTKAIFDLRVTGGYQGAFVIGATGRDRRTGEEEITAKARGLDIQLGRNHFGQIVFSTVNDLAAISSLTAFDDSMMGLSFWCHPRVDQQENIKRYAYGPEPSTGRNTGLEREIRDEDAIDNWGEQGGEAVRVNEAVRRQAVADDVAMRELLRDADVPHDGGFVSDLRGTSLSVGQLITVTTEWAHWPSTEAHVVKVTGLYPQGNATELLTRVTFEDVHRLMSTPANALAGMVGPAWGQPIGSSVGLTSQPIGSSVAGTSRRLS